MKPRAVSLTGELLPPSLVGVMVLLDRSGSMGSLKAPMEKAFKDFVTNQKSIAEEGMWVTLHQFDSEGYDEVYNRTPLANVGALHLAPRGGTPLRDALYSFVKTAREVIDDANDPTERLLLVIITDGQENASTKYTWEQVREAIKGIESTDCETMWLGTSAAIMEAQQQVSTFQRAGASVTYDPNNAASIGYAGSTFTVAATGMRTNSSARGMSMNYMSATNSDDVDDWNAKAQEIYKQAAETLSAKAARKTQELSKSDA